MKSKKNSSVKYKIAISCLLIFLLAFSANAQSNDAKKVDTEQAKKEAFERGDDIVIKMVDENGVEMKYIATRQAYMAAFEKIREYEKQNNITERSNNEYLVNANFEFVEVRNKKK